MLLPGTRSSTLLSSMSGPSGDTSVAHLTCKRTLACPTWQACCVPTLGRMSCCCSWRWHTNARTQLAQSISEGPGPGFVAMHFLLCIRMHPSRGAPLHLPACGSLSQEKPCSELTPASHHGAFQLELVLCHACALELSHVRSLCLFLSWPGPCFIMLAWRLSQQASSCFRGLRLKSSWCLQGIHGRPWLCLSSSANHLVEAFSRFGSPLF